MSESSIDVDGFVAMCHELYRVSPKKLVPIMLDQAGTVLDLCIQRSPPSSTKKKSVEEAKHSARLRIEKPARYMASHGTLVSNRRAPRTYSEPYLQTLTGTRGGQKGREWYVTRRNGKPFYIPQEKLRGVAYWTKAAKAFMLFEQLEPKVQRAWGSIGAMKKSWVQIADRIGATLRKNKGFVASVRSGFDDGGMSFIDVKDEEGFIEMVNTNMLLIAKYDGARILQGAFDTREAAFVKEMQKGVFDDMAYRAKRYPGIFVT